MAGLLGGIGLLALAGPWAWLAFQFMSAGAARIGLVEICLLAQLSIMGGLLIGLAEIIDRSRQRHDTLASLLGKLSDNVR